MSQPPRASRRPGVAILGSVLLVLFGCLVGLGLSEAGYRAYLYRSQPERFTSPDRESYFTAYNVSHWEFDEEFGYVYPPERVIDYTGAKDGYVKDCDRFKVINKYGNIGPIVGSYEEADLKILVFGDSWAAFQQEGRTWPLFLQEVLEKRLGKKVHVVNFGRDGYGLLQMFDLGAAKIPEWKPDLAIFTFITNDLTRARFWRTVVGKGDHVRVLTTLDPVRNPAPERSADTYLLMPSATYEWCQSMKGTKRVDGLLTRLVEKHRTALANNDPTGKLRVASLVTVAHSYLYNLLVKGDPFDFLWSQIPTRVNPRFPFEDYSKDERFMRDFERIRATGVPWITFHLAFYPEIRANQEYILNPPEAALLSSLEVVTGKRVLRTTDYVEMPLPQPERMNFGADNYHPSLWGMEFYAKAVAEALVRSGLVGGPARPSVGRSGGGARRTP